MRLRNALVLVVVASAALMGTPTAQAEADRVGYGERISKKIVKHIRGTHYCQMKMDRPRTKVRLLFTKQSIHRRRYVLRVWIDRHDDFCDALRKHQKQRRAFGGYGRPPHYSQWLCIHSHEGAWNANTGNGYYGGLQMDMSFQSAYGGHLLRTKGTANNWTPMEQMWVAERAYSSGRGFGPWPNTARMCGLR